MKNYRRWCKFSEKNDRHKLIEAEGNEIQIIVANKTAAVGSTRLAHGYFNANLWTILIARIQKEPAGYISAREENPHL
jgi:hypothetical protein